MDANVGKVLSTGKVIRSVVAGRLDRGRRASVIALSALIVVAGVGSVAPSASADTGPTLTSIDPNTVSAAGGATTLLVSGSDFDSTWSLRWRGVDYPIAPYFDIDSDSARCCVATIPGSALAIEDPFLTVAAFLVMDGAASNAQPVTILGDGVSAGSSALANAGGTATVATALLSARYTRAGAGFGIVTAVDYVLRPGASYLPPNPISPIAFVDLQVRNAAAGDTLVGTFLPPSPILPPNPVLPPNPILPPSPIRLAYWTGTTWAPVLGSGGVAPSFAFDYATTTASSETVVFDASSTPQITALGGTVFAFVASYGFVGFDHPIENGAINTAKAGRAVPLKWRVLDLGGNPVAGLDPTSVSLTSAAVSCATLDGEETALDAYASGASGLQNLGDGYHQWNWATQRSWAGSCRRLSLQLGDADPWGDAISHQVEFAFRD